MTATTSGAARTGEHRNLLAAKVIRARTDRGMTSREQLAATSGIAIRIISDIEKGRRTNFTASTQAKLERALGWEHGSVNAVLAGGSPIRPEGAPPLDAAGDDLELEVRAILSSELLPPPLKYQVLEEAQRFRHRQATERRRMVAWLERVRQHGTASSD